MHSHEKVHRDVALGSLDGLPLVVCNSLHDDNDLSAFNRGEEVSLVAPVVGVLDLGQLRIEGDLQQSSDLISTAFARSHLRTPSYRP